MFLLNQKRCSDSDNDDSDNEDSGSDYQPDGEESTSESDMENDDDDDERKRLGTNHENAANKRHDHKPKDVDIEEPKDITPASKAMNSSVSKTKYGE